MISEKNKRQSNFELLRILCMAGVLVGHALIVLYQDQIHSADWSVTNQLRVLMLNACAVALNCFVMISGYFTIRTNGRKVIRFWSICLWYAVLAWICLGGSWVSVLFPITQAGMWFLPCYLALVLICPLLNAGLEALGGKRLYKCVGLLLLADIYVGYWHQSAEIGVNGYGIFHFVTLYCMGYTIAHRDICMKNAGVWCAGCFLLMTVLHAVKVVWPPMAAIYSLHYNSPALICAAVLVFLWAKGQNVQSRVINWVASSVFAVYLVHCSPVVYPYFQQGLWSIKESCDSEGMSAVLIGLLLTVIFVGSILIDKVRMGVFGLIESVWQHRK